MVTSGTNRSKGLESGPQDTIQCLAGRFHLKYAL